MVFAAAIPTFFGIWPQSPRTLLPPALEENYRSAPDILQAALGVISHNEGETRSMTARKAGRRPVRIAVVEDERREDNFCSQRNQSADWRYRHA